MQLNIPPPLSPNPSPEIFSGGGGPETSSSVKKTKRVYNKKNATCNQCRTSHRKCTVTRNKITYLAGQIPGPCDHCVKRSKTIDPITKSKLFHSQHPPLEDENVLLILHECQSPTVQKVIKKQVENLAIPPTEEEEELLEHPNPVDDDDNSFMFSDEPKAPSLEQSSQSPTAPHFNDDVNNSFTLEEEQELLKHPNPFDDDDNSFMYTVDPKDLTIQQNSQPPNASHLDDDNSFMFTVDPVAPSLQQSSQSPNAPHFNDDVNNSFILTVDPNDLTLQKDSQ